MLTLDASRHYASMMLMMCSHTMRHDAFVLTHFNMASTHSDTHVSLALQNQAIAAFLLKNKQKSVLLGFMSCGWLARKKGIFLKFNCRDETA